jgi:multicomponent Na+:H+ antiporter subunit B
LITYVLLTMLAVMAIAIIRIRSLIAVIMLSGMYSLLTALLFVLMDAVDVALTEAAVGAGISIILLLATLSLTGETRLTKKTPALLPLIVVVLTGMVLIYGTLDMPHYADPNAPVHQHLGIRFIQDSPQEIGIPNMVTSVLASYRGFDTLGEIVVVFVAGVAVMLLLSNRRRRPASSSDPTSARDKQEALDD